MNHYINKHTDNTTNKLRQMKSKDPKKHWKLLRKNKNRNNTKTSIPTINEFYQHFKNVNKNDDPSVDNSQSFYNNDTDFNDTILNSQITTDEILKCIAHLKNSKTPCKTDNILNEYIKSTKDRLLPVYVFLFNAILDTGHMPETWLSGTIYPIYKGKCQSSEPNNYRPITILSCPEKLFTAILNNRINIFLEENNLLKENQAGFRKGSACSDHLFSMNCLFNILKRRKHKLFCCFVDFSQAFDKVWRIGLWSKLITTGVNGKIFNVIYQMYQNIKSCVSLNGESSSYFVCENGVRQGENLSPILFSIFLNDLESHLIVRGGHGIDISPDLNEQFWLKILVLLYADDTVLLAESAYDLQKNLNLFQEYCSQWNLKVNPSKIKVVVFGAKNKSFYNFQLDDNNLEITDSYKYLGLVLSSNGSFLNTRKHLAEQGRKAYHSVLVQARTLNLPIDLQVKLFDHTVVPILLYDSEIWGYESHEILEKVHIEFLRKITKQKNLHPDICYMES